MRQAVPPKNKAFAPGCKTLTTPALIIPKPLLPTAQSIGLHLHWRAALSSVDYTKQTYLSSLVFPLIAMNFRSDFGFSDEVKADIVKTILASQLSDGGFPYSTEDSGYGVTSDTDTTSMAVQALAPYYKTDDAVRAAVDKALDHL